MSNTLETILLIIAMAVLCVIIWTPARAQSLHLPPVVYDIPYKGKLTIETVTREQLYARCSVAGPLSLACAFPGGDKCHIIIVSEAEIIATGWTRELLLRHERAHCNGWPGDHPGKRPYP